jgi:hypothetical protein
MDFIEIIESSRWDASWKETAYSAALAKHLSDTAGVIATPEAPIQGIGTKFDLHMEYSGEDWLISVKRGLDSQDRKTLQGELEDALRCWRRDQNRRLHVVMLIGIESETPLMLAHIGHLARHLGNRRRSLMKPAGNLPSPPDIGYDFDLAFVKIEVAADLGSQN